MIPLTLILPIVVLQGYEQAQIELHRTLEVTQDHLNTHHPLARTLLQERERIE
jgi:hypothetical protein